MGASHVAQMVKNPPAIQETQVWSLSQEDLLEKEMAIHSSILAWRIPWTEELGGYSPWGSQRVGHDWATNTFTTQGLVLWNTVFPQVGVREGWFWNDSSTFHLSYMLFLWLLHQLFRISLGIRSRRLGTPDLQDEISSCFWDRQGPSWCTPHLLGYVHLWPFPPPPPSPAVWSSW